MCVSGIYLCSVSWQIESFVLGIEIFSRSHLKIPSCCIPHVREGYQNSGHSPEKGSRKWGCRKRNGGDIFNACCRFWHGSACWAVGGVPFNKHAAFKAAGQYHKPILEKFLSFLLVCSRRVRTGGREQNHVQLLQRLYRVGFRRKRVPVCRVAKNVHISE